MKSGFSHQFKAREGERERGKVSSGFAIAEFVGNFGRQIFQAQK